MTDTQTVANWYNLNANLEHDRLILDLGGGTGRYAVKLAQLGHAVILVDISQSELDVARLFAAQSGVSLAGIQQADARHIRQYASSILKMGDGDEGYDLILCQGPLYHLMEESERLEVVCVCACAAMLRPGGFFLAAFVTKFAHLRDLAQRDPMRLWEEQTSFYRDYLFFFWR
ncbi:hypothetical protein VTN77DRAFT_9625 [Rasamsonia byssochlamydoides]|uniref:uncharacterized protein n=1 Tax=Rasamsonia byssochlamydoides TaxID=89139 RepID=UPI0037444CA0